MKFNKFLTLILVLVISVCIFVACEKQPDQPVVPEITDFTVTFKADDKVVGSYKVEKGELAHPILAPQKYGYDFSAWQLDGVDFDFANTKIEKDVTLVANYTQIVITEANFQFNSKTGTIVDYVSPDPVISDIVIPDTIRGQKVVALGGQLFQNNTDITSVTIPATVTSIETSVFDGCTNLKTVNFATRPTENDTLVLGTHVFANCTSLVTITLPESIKNISTGTFQGCTKLTTVGNLEKVMMIGVSAFEDCTSLEKVTLDGAYQIGGKAFANCANLTTITLADTVNTLGEQAFLNCSKLASFNVPANVTTLNLNVLQGCDSLSIITVSADNTKYVADNNVLYEKNYSGVINKLYFVPSFVTTLQLPETVSSVATTAFNDANNLATITVAEGNTTYTSVNGVLYKINSKQVLTNLVMVPAQYQGDVTLFAGTTTIDTYALTNAQKVTKIVIEEDNVNFVEIDHLIYKRTSATSKYYTLITANRDYSGEVTIMKDCDTTYSLSGINDGAFAYSQITGINFVTEKFTGVTLDLEVLANVVDNFVITANEAWKVTLVGTEYSRWITVADMITWVSAE